MGTVDINKMIKVVQKKGFEKVGTMQARKGHEIPYWIPTGSLWLDGIICSGKMGGIPGGCITEIAGLPSCVSEYSVVDVSINVNPNSGNMDGCKRIKISEIESYISAGDIVFIKSRNSKNLITYEKIESVIKKGRQTTKVFILDDENTFECAQHHYVLTKSGWDNVASIEAGKTSVLCDDMQWHIVVGIEDGDEVTIYDLEVPSTHCYFADGVLHHNSGKSYLAAQILVNAQKMGIFCVWFDSENAADATFIEKMGADLEQILYQPVDSIEDVFEISQALMEEMKQPILFIWDSVANTPSKKEWDATFDPTSVVGLPARTLSFGLRRIMNLVADTKSTFLMLNQLKTNIGPTAMSEPYFTPCGKAIQFNAHLRLFLTSRKAKSHHVFDSEENKIGSDLKVDIKKSRFGTEGRKCALKILWGSGVRICDEESWLEAIEGSQYYDNRKSWKYLYMDNDKKGEPVKFQAANWLEMLKDDKFRERVKWIISVEMIERFANKTESDSFGFKDPDDFIAEE